jgi:hypothetical protein
MAYMSLSQENSEDLIERLGAAVPNDLRPAWYRACVRALP